ncbi:hypothetical protein [Natronosalvus vescus]|uniref:hypothetical protein n=1 Tax=Natronosalvus vescus TaxID=2953881 RepID=UPI0020903928|nr:hypothetical protein [Natronosalvus vescus]
MASEDHEDGAVSVALPADLEDWLEAEAAQRGVSRNQFCQQLLSAMRTADDDTEFEPADVAALESLRTDLESQRREFIDHVEDVRDRVIQVKGEADGKAPVDHDHDDYAGEEAVETLEARLTALEDQADQLEQLGETVDSGFENFETVLEHVLETTDELDRRSTTLAKAVLDLREQRDSLASRERRRSEVDELRLAANRLGVRTATCESCAAAVDIALLTEPRCPHCGSAVADVSAKTSFFGSNRLETGEPPALAPGAEAAVETSDDGSLFETVEEDADDSATEHDVNPGERDA